MSLLERELREQPAALARLLERQSEYAAELGALLHRDDVRYLLIASRGSSSNAARYAQYLLGRASRVPVEWDQGVVYEITDGRVTRIRNYNSLDEALKAAGMAE